MKKNKNLTIRITEQDKKILDKMREKDFNVGSFVRRALRKRFERIQNQKILGR